MLKQFHCQMGIEKIETGECRPCFEKSTRIAGVPRIRRTKSYWDASSSSAGVKQMTYHSLTKNTAIFDEFVRSLKRHTHNLPHNQNRRSRDMSRSGEWDRNSSMDRRIPNDSRKNTRSIYENDTRDTRNTYMPSRNRQDTRDDSGRRYGQRYKSRERRP